MVKRSSWGTNHKGEKILRISTERCEFCQAPLIYTEFLFQLATETTGSETDRLIQIQQIEEMIDKVKKGEKLPFLSVLLGCNQHYKGIPKEVLAKQQLKPYITLDAEDIFHLNNTDISKVYIAVK